MGRRRGAAGVAIVSAMLIAAAVVVSTFGRTDNAPSAPATGEVVRPPWTGPVHRDYRDITRLSARIHDGMTQSEVTAVLGRPTRIARMRQNSYWFFATDDGDLRIFFDHSGIERYDDGQMRQIRYLSPETRTTSELQRRIRVGMTRNAVIDAIGAPDNVRTTLGGGGPIPFTDMAPRLWRLEYQCRDGRLALLLDDSPRVLLIMKDNAPRPPAGGHAK